MGTTSLPGHLASAVGLMGGGDLSETLLRGHLLRPVETRGAVTARFDAPREEFSFESATAYAERGLDLIRRLSGDVETDCVVQSRGINFVGHVYNLHTDEGWYASNGHVVSNCDCGVAGIYGDNDPGQVIDGPLLDKAHQTVMDTFGVSDASARRPDYRKLLMTHDHSELGPVLARKGHA